MSFFDKLAGSADEGAADSIARNLTAVLNAKRGHAAAIEVLGLGRYDGHFATKPLTDALIVEMLEIIRRFEPRLREPSLVLLGRDRLLWVRFELTGVSDAGPCAFSVLFHSIFRNVQVIPA